TFPYPATAVRRLRGETVRAFSSGAACRHWGVSGDDRHQFVAQTLRLVRQSVERPLAIRLLVGLLPLTHILLTALQQPVHTLRDLPCCRYDRFRAPTTRLNPAIERPQRILGVMTTLSRHAQSTCGPIGATPYPTAEDVPRAAPMLRTQPQPT